MSERFTHSRRRQFRLAIRTGDLGVSDMAKNAPKRDYESQASIPRSGGSVSAQYLRGTIGKGLALKMCGGRGG